MEKYIIFVIFIYSILPLIPYNNYSLSIFLLFLSVILFFLSIFTNRFVRGTITVTYVRSLILFFFIIFFSMFLLLLNTILIEITRSNSYEIYLTVTLVSVTIAITVILLIELLFKLLLKVKDPTKLSRKFEKIEAISNLFITFLATFFIPNYVFGFDYMLLLEVFHNVTLTPFEFYYLGFVIDYTLPLDDKKLLDCINKINSNNVIRIVQIVHITLSKFFDLTILGILINYINNIFKIKKTLD
jgi:hypothetical protein